MSSLAVADIDRSQAERVAAECGCPAFTDYRQLLEQTDAVSVAVPTSLHHEVAMACFSKNVDLLLEKPMTVTLDRG